MSILWLVCLLSAYLGVAPAAARTVVVVYDDSGSMTQPPAKWWQANYAMQTLTALLTPQDRLSVVFMSRPGLAVPWPDQRAALQELQNQIPPNAQTPFQALETAMRAVEQSRDEDRWLIVITDGGFNEYPPEDRLRERIQQFAGATGAKTVFLLIGTEVSDSLPVFWDAIASAQTFRAVSSRDITPRMQEIAALVNGRPLAPGQLRLAAQGNQISLATEMPLKRLTIFQQEDQQRDLAVVRQAEVGAAPLQTNGLVAKMPQRAQLSKFAGITHITQKIPNQVIPEATLTITLERPVALSRLTFFPEVAARFELHLEKEDGSPLSPTSQNIYQVCVGRKIRLVARLLDPHSQQPLSVTIKHPEKITVTANYQKKDYALTLEPQKRFFTALIPVQMGQEPLGATASFPGYFYFKSKVFIIDGIPCYRKLALEPTAPWSAKVTELAQAPALRLLPTADGQPVSPEEFRNWTLTIRKAPPVQLQIKKQGDHWLVRPQGNRWSCCFTPTGSMPLEVEISSSHPGETIRETLEFTIENVHWWTKCGWLIILLLATLIFLWWLIGIIRKRRFCRGSAIVYHWATRTQQGRPYTYALPTSFWQRWLVPYRAERRLVEGICFIAGQRCSYIYVAKESLTDQMSIDGQPVIDPAHQERSGRDKRLDNNSRLAVHHDLRDEYYQYSSGN